MKSSRSPLCLAALVAAAVCMPHAGSADSSPVTSGVLAQAADEAPKEIIAAHIRMQGFACEKPLSAERDRGRSKPNETVWLLRCENHTYQVRLVPDMAADVRELN